MPSKPRTDPGQPELPLAAAVPAPEPALLALPPAKPPHPPAARAFFRLGELLRRNHDRDRRGRAA
jgi:hypothetical protein